MCTFIKRMLGAVSSRIRAIRHDSASFETRIFLLDELDPRFVDVTEERPIGFTEMIDDTGEMFLLKRRYIKTDGDMTTEICVGDNDIFGPPGFNVLMKVSCLGCYNRGFFHFPSIYSDREMCERIQSLASTAEDYVTEAARRLLGDWGTRIKTGWIDASLGSPSFRDSTFKRIDECVANMDVAGLQMECVNLEIRRVADAELYGAVIPYESE